jgi:glutamate---cysteine ligase / carboxylate-amine ligase
VPTSREVGMLAAIVPCLVHLFDTQLDRGYSLPSRSPWVIEDNKWRATRHGLDATIVTSDSGQTAPLRDEVFELIRDLEPVAWRLGCPEELSVAAEVLECGAPYERQRAIYTGDEDLTSVVDATISEFAEDKFVLRGAARNG